MVLGDSARRMGDHELHWLRASAQRAISEWTTDRNMTIRDLIARVDADDEDGLRDLTSVLLRLGYGSYVRTVIGAPPGEGSTKFNRPWVATSTLDWSVGLCACGTPWAIYDHMPFEEVAVGCVCGRSFVVYARANQGSIVL
jgi:hypothetical protein